MNCMFVPLKAEALELHKLYPLFDSGDGQNASRLGQRSTDKGDDVDGDVVATRDLMGGPASEVGTVS